MSMARQVLVLAFGMVLAATPARPDELGPAMPSTPAALEAPLPSAPIVVRQRDAETFLRGTPPRAETPAPPPADGTREFTADEPPKPVVNPTSRFVFEDQTERTAVPQKSLSARQAAVEALRQSVRKPGGIE